MDCEVAAAASVMRCSSASEKRQRIAATKLQYHESDIIAGNNAAAAAQSSLELIPGLPNDVALQCLVRIPCQAHAQLQRVSRNWRQLLHSPLYYWERKRQATTMHFVCTVQPLPPQPSATVPDQSSSPPSSPQLLQLQSSSCSTSDGAADHQPANNARSRSRSPASASSNAATTSASSRPPSPPPPALGISVFMNPRERASREHSPPPCRRRLAHIPEHPHGLPLFCRLVGVNGKLVVLGGWDPVTWETLRSVYVYEFASQSWRRGADMPSTRSSFAACAAAVLSNDRRSGYATTTFVFVAGGHDNRKSALATAEVYDLERDQWRTDLPRMSEERDECAAATLCDDGNRIFVIGGYATAFQGKFSKSADVYELATNTWTRIEHMAPPRDHHRVSSCCCSSGGGVFAVLSGTLYTLDRGTLFSYSAATNAWSSVASLPAEVDEICAAAAEVCLTAVDDDSLLVLLKAGGSAGARGGHGGRGASSSSSSSSLRASSSSEVGSVADDDQACRAFVCKPGRAFQSSAASAAAEELQDGGGPQWEELGCKDHGILTVPQFACAVEV